MVERLSSWVGRPVFWWTAMALLGGIPLVSGLLRPPPPVLPVLGQLPATGIGRLIVFADPACAGCQVMADQRMRGLSRHLRGVRPAFELVWIPLGDGAPAPPGVRVLAGPAAAPFLTFSEGRPELRESRRALLVDSRGRVRGFPRLDPGAEGDLLPAVTQLVNGR